VLSHVGCALGRRRALSKVAINATLAAQRSLAPPLFAASRRRLCITKLPDILPEEDSGSAPHAGKASPEDEDAAHTLEAFVGTALVLAFLQVAALVPVAELARRLSEVKAHFGDFTVRFVCVVGLCSLVVSTPRLTCARAWVCAAAQTPAGWDFGKTQTDFVTLLSPGVLNSTHRWLVRARLWRLILSQNTEGWWDASSTTAFACEARAAAETASIKPTLLMRLVGLVRAAVETAAESGGTFETALEGAARHDTGATSLDDILASGEQGEESVRIVQRTKSSLAPSDNADADAGMAMDCPLTCFPSAIVTSLPRRLVRLREADPAVEEVRVWTTLCCISVLERMNNSWIWGDGCVC
jgi:hypothetical protein